MFDSPFEWIIDSGSTQHIVTSELYFDSLTDLNEPIPLYVAAPGSELRAHKYGSINIVTHGDDRKYNLEITDVLLIPNVRANLLSLRKLEDSGYEVLFKDGLVRFIKDGITVAKGIRDKNLYKLVFKFKNKSNIPSELQHVCVRYCRFGHTNVDYPRSDSEITQCLNNHKGVCSTCICNSGTGVMHRSRFEAFAYYRTL